MNKIFVGAGTALALLAMSAQAVFAQTNLATEQYSPQPQSSAQAPASPRSTYPGIQNLTDEVLVAGDAEDVVRRVYEPVPVRPMNQNDRVTRVSRESWLAKGWSNESFDAMRQQNVGLCQRTTYFATRFADLADRYAATQPRVADLANRYDAMRGKIKRAGTFRTIGNVLQVGIAAALITPAYAAVVAPGAVSNEISGRASTKQQLLGNDAGLLNNELTGYHVEFNLLSLELYQDYLGLMVGYCTDNKTIASYDGGRTTTSSVSYSYTPAPAAQAPRQQPRPQVPAPAAKQGW